MFLSSMIISTKHDFSGTNCASKTCGWLARIKKKHQSDNKFFLTVQELAIGKLGTKSKKINDFNAEYSDAEVGARMDLESEVNDDSEKGNSSENPENNFDEKNSDQNDCEKDNVSVERENVSVECKNVSVEQWNVSVERGNVSAEWGNVSNKMEDDSDTEADAKTETDSKTENDSKMENGASELKKESGRNEENSDGGACVDEFKNTRLVVEYFERFY